MHNTGIVLANRPKMYFLIRLMSLFYINSHAFNYHYDFKSEYNKYNNILYISPLQIEFFYI